MKLKIWIDADACPKMIKDVVFKASMKLKVPVCLVANNFISAAQNPLISSVQVAKGPDIADLYIADNIDENAIVITADIPLADLVVKKGAVAINPRGELYTEENIGERLSVRDFMQGLRDNGIDTGGPSPISLKDKERFANSLNRLLTKMMK